MKARIGELGRSGGGPAEMSRRRSDHQARITSFPDIPGCPIWVPTCKSSDAGTAAALLLVAQAARSRTSPSHSSPRAGHDCPTRNRLSNSGIPACFQRERGIRFAARHPRPATRPGREWGPSRDQLKPGRRHSRRARRRAAWTETAPPPYPNESRRRSGNWWRS
jgi:hypothetical protein